MTTGSRVRTRGARQRLHMLGLGGALLLLLAGCGTEGAANPTPERTDAAETSQPTVEAPPASASASAEELVNAFEAEGLMCEEVADDDLRGGVAQQFNCKGDDYLIMTLRDYESIDARDTQLSVIESMACKIAETGQDVQRVAVSDTWIIMPGGDRDIDFEVFGNATATLGLDSTDVTC